MNAERTFLDGSAVGRAGRRWRGWLWAGMAIAWLWAGTGEMRVESAEEGSADNGSGPWRHLFDGKSLAGWKVAGFGGHGEVSVEEGELRLEMGAMLTGVTYTNPVLRINYEVALEAKKTLGNDFFCGLTVPYKDTNCTLIVGGWGGGVVGISSLDHYDASENDATIFRSFAKDRWYDIRMRVTEEKIQVWIDNDRVIDVLLKDRVVGMRAGEIEISVPLGIATYQTSVALRNLRVRSVSGPAE